MDIVTIFTTPPLTTTPFLQAGNATKNALFDIAKILHQVEDIPTPQNNDITSAPQRVEHNQRSEFSKINNKIKNKNEPNK